MSLADQLAQGVQFAPPPDPFAQYGKMQQLQQGQQQMQISQMQLDELKRDREGMVQFQKDLAAKGGNPDLEEYANMMLRSNNSAHQKMGIELKQKLMEQKQFASIYGGGAPAVAPVAPTAAPTTLPAAAPENALGSGTFGMAPAAAPVNALAPTPAAPVNALTPNPAAADIVEMRRKRDALLAMGTPRALEAARSLNADIAIASKPAVFHNVQNVGLVNPLTSQVVMPSVEPTATSVKEYNFAKTPAGGNFRGTYQDFVAALATAGRAPVQPVAPTITQVVDPNNPKQMLNVNARSYNGGSVGGTGVIGVAGREPGYVAREEKAATKQTETARSKEQVDTLVAQLGGYYDTLSNEGGITSTGQKAGSNAMAGMASSGLGQATGRLFGTQAQSQRNSIVQTRPLLVQAIKTATGMSAKQMDSNVELKMMLATATDPQLDIESNRRALANLARLYGTGSGAAPTATPAATPNIDALLNKYK